MAAADNRNTVNIAVPLVGIVVDETGYLLWQFLTPPNITEDHLPGIPCTDQHDILLVRTAEIRTGIPQKENKPIGKTYSKHKDKLDH